MALTQITDVIVPVEFLGYVFERTATVSRFFASGIVDTDPAFAALAAGGGQTINMPFWQDLTGSDQVLSDTGALTTKKIVATQDAAVLHNRGDAWSTSDLAGILAGSDPMGTIAILVGDYWARKHNEQLLATVGGVFAASNMTGNILDVSTTVSGVVTSDNVLNGVNFINAKQLLGDAKEKLVAIAMHSAVQASLLKLDLIDYIPVTDARRTIETFQGLEVIIDDNMPASVVNGVMQYTTVLFGQGAYAFGVSGVNYPIEGAPAPSTWQVEFSRVALAGQNVMINRRRFILHPRGVKWTGNTMTGPSPTNAELALAANWTRVYEQKNIRMVAIKHNILL
jgi:hypothetical protein